MHCGPRSCIGNTTSRWFSRPGPAIRRAGLQVCLGHVPVFSRVGCAVQYTIWTFNPASIGRHFGHSTQAEVRDPQKRSRRHWPPCQASRESGWASLTDDRVLQAHHTQTSYHCSCTGHTHSVLACGVPQSLAPFTDMPSTFAGSPGAEDRPRLDLSMYPYTNAIVFLNFLYAGPRLS